ncbi:LSU ribosomal protein L25p [hydrothermal vent metagenome]|uniref:LSU ribosomal protein L25p n=1 Tax=hydrothermal vent metagenome TaxID=652676 RepID=A0A1W1CNL3_9ZZZZ
MSAEISASVREVKGKGSSRRLRHESKIPGIVYGAGKEAVNLELDFFYITKILNDESLFTTILDLKVGSKKEKVVIKDLQRHPAKKTISHIDFLRIDLKRKIKLKVPVRFINKEKSKSLRLGAVLNQFLSSIEISCLAGNLPETIDVDVSKIKIGESIRLSQIEVPKGVTITALTHGDLDSYDQTIVSITKARKMEAVVFDDEVVASEETDDKTEPEAESKEDSKE